MTSRFDNINISRALFKSSDLSPHLQSHLKKVYFSLTWALLCATVGSLLPVYHFVTYGTFALSLLTLFALFFTSIDQTYMRIALLGIFGVLQGVTISPLLQTVASLHGGQKIISTALAATTIIFVSFSGAALYSPRRSFLYLGGSLMTGLNLLLLMGLVNLFALSPFIFSVELYLGVFIFVGFVVYDTQMILEKADMGNTDYIIDALGLFLDFISLFIRILIILAKKADDKKSRR
eukprot:TRINITY_DN1885_c0_g1_i1.p1 TRINITY_DN1885_c0_g1~~TRINITY_DN1885_c0_g1_i1.p1  ORF type:complete len:235 (-),score=26.00 TRINITY_DN1885_c0_g1_i1:129-833(-)